MSAVCRYFISLWGLGFKAEFLHQTASLVATDRISLCLQLLGNTPRTIFTTMFLENGNSPGFQRRFLGAVARSIGETMKIIVKSTPAHFHYPTQHGNGIGLLFSPDKVVPQFDSFAKKAAAFFNISRSISSRLFSFLSRRTSASSSCRVCPPSLRSCWSWRCSLTQRETFEVGISRRRPTSGQLYPCSVTSLMASCLNSFV